MRRSHPTGLLALGWFIFSTTALLHASEDSPIGRRIEAAGENPALAAIAAADDWIRGVRSSPYAPLAAKHATLKSFRVETRSDKMRHAPCNLCHIDQITEVKRGIVADPTAVSHGSIEIVHAPVERMVCATCHDYQHDMQPRFGSGKTLDFDRTYELCAGCHATQYADWQGGAHGKRIGNWAGTRIVRSCTGCHDPHRPKFPRRAPAIYAAPPSSWEPLRP